MRKSSKKLKMYPNARWKILELSILVLIVLAIFFASLLHFLNYMEGENALEFYHWWTSSGEKAAIDALTNVFAEKYPEVTVLSTSVISRSSGGGGTATFNLLQPMVFNRDAPDAFQMHAGYGTKLYYDAGLLHPVTNIWESEGLIKVAPRVVQAMCKFGNEFYSVPINVHRTNVVWYNKKILDRHNINPENLTDWDSFFGACDKLRNKGIEYPIQMGTTWTAQHTFDQIIASIGMDLYEDWVNGEVTSPDDVRLIKALTIFKKYLSYTNLNHADIGWDNAVDNVISGEGAFNIMGDWANGEFKAAEKEYGVDYGTFAVPGTDKMYGIVIDVFQLPKNINHPQNAENWLKLVASSEGQDTFNPLKGSISTRIDTNISKYDSYQQSAILDFLTLKYMYPAVSNGLPKAFEQKEQEIIAEFSQDLDIFKAAEAITTYTKETSRDYVIEWELD